jgi:hypothetical protein
MRWVKKYRISQDGLLLTPATHAWYCVFFRCNRLGIGARRHLYINCLYEILRTGEKNSGDVADASRRLHLNAVFAFHYPIFPLSVSLVH